MGMKTVTLEQFKGFNPCWMETKEGAERLERIGKIKAEWTALDVLDLADVSAEEKLWAILREEFIDAEILHEFACRCAEYALSYVDNPDPRSVAAIEAKRKWIRGEITGKELDAARYAASAAASVAAWDAARDAALAAAWAARAAEWAAENAARDAALAAAWAARDAARDAALAAAWAAAREHEIEMLRTMLDCWRKGMMAEYIERQKVFDGLPIVKEDKAISLYGAVADFMVIVSDIPAADVAPVVHGKWVTTQIAAGLPWKYRCSNCGCPQEYAHNYCPNCGAKMEGERE